MNKKIGSVTVSVVSISYNHEDYIEQMLESVVSQETDFAFELIIGDDCSTDKTPTIIQRFAKQYPDIIKPVLRKKNVGVQRNLIDVMTKAKGTYMAICEGDDFWTDKKKLQKQVTYMESHPDCALSFHPVRVFFEGKSDKDRVFPEEKNGHTLAKLLEGNFIQTNSVMYRVQPDYQKLRKDVMPLDWYLHLYHAQFGKIGFLYSVMSAYRRHEQGLWWEQSADIEKLWLKNGPDQVALFAAALDMYGDTKRYRDIVEASVAFLLDNFLDLDQKHHAQLFAQVQTRFPELVEVYSRGQLSNIRSLFDDRERLKLANKNLEGEIATMKSTKAWRLHTKVSTLRAKAGKK